MARFFGVIGYGTAVETPSGSGIWVDDIVEYSYYGDVVRNIGRLEEGENLNNNIKVQNSISVVADSFIEENFLSIRYIEWLGSKWTVSSIEVKPPRLVLSLGDPYNGPIPEEV